MFFLTEFFLTIVSYQFSKNDWIFKDYLLIFKTGNGRVVENILVSIDKKRQKGKILLQKTLLKVFFYVSLNFFH